MLSILEGKRPAGNGEENLDYINPIRGANETTQLLLAKFSNYRIHLTSHLGLSNILVWMGTGQGHHTRKFIGLGEMFFTSFDSCVARFQTTYDHNLALMSTVSEGQDNYILKHPSYIPIDHMGFYGQPNFLLAVVQSRSNKTSDVDNNSDNPFKHSIEHKFRPYFAPELEEQWRTFLGDMAGKMVDDYSGKRHTWKETLDFIENLGVVGFGSGLTPFQTTHSMAILGICAMATPEEIADWISLHPDLGAQTGLKSMGFLLTSQASAKAAFLIFYHHLDTHLSENDKDRLRFSPMFTEHILCKGPRWTHVLKRVAQMDLSVLADTEQKLEETLGKVWYQGHNETDNGAYPFPLLLKREDAAAYLDTLE